ncbi:kelch-like protein 20 [Actinia tenebrosa]|uniref:Kelch-like protein 20 n=1 Tax=Actinia tenebrosa TaxID=6105 RepID=A0A6P8II66_ACTTE|nr:kelch-like protein 20 [Actinia tenebrosa]
MEASTSADQESTSETLMIENVVLNEESSLDFSSPWHFSDVVLVVEDTKFHVHKCILSMWSPVFRTMFTSQFMESNAKEIPLPGKHSDEMEVLLKHIYSSGTKATVTEENYQFLLQLILQIHSEEDRELLIKSD